MILKIASLIVFRWQVYVCLSLPVLLHGCHGVRTSPHPGGSRGAASWEMMGFATSEERDALARSDPLSFLRKCRERCVALVRDYRCRFIKEEVLNGTVGSEQQMIVLFREEPFSVDMRWIKGARRARRVSYVAGRWSEDGPELAHIDLNGVLGVLVPGGVKRDIHGKHTMAESRKPIDRFGFKNTLDAIIEWCERARHEDGYRLTFAGERSLEGRPSYVFERWLPPAREGLPCPDRRLVVFIDREWLLPTGSLSYSDDAKKDLLGRYVLTDVEINIGLTDADFE